MTTVEFRQRVMDGVRSRLGQGALAGLILVAGSAAYFANEQRADKIAADTELSSITKSAFRLYHPTSPQWATLTVEPVVSQVFRSEQITEGKLAVDEDNATPIFSPYSGRVVKLFAKAGDQVERGQPLFVIEATDMVQAQNDFVGAATALNKARSQLNLAEITEKRNRDLYQAKAVPLKEWQQAQAALVTAQNDARSSDTAFEAAHNRLRILGKSEDEIAAFHDRGVISPATPIHAPISGTIVQRKIGPGQYVGAGASDPVFVIGDLSTVWLYAYVRETEAPKVRVGQAINFTVLAYPEQIFEAKVNYVAAALDPATRRLVVRATIDNPQGLLKPEMFASVTLFSGDERMAAAVPRDALIYEGGAVRIWVARDDKAIELRQVRTGLASGRMVQVLDGVQPGERVITKGSLFIDRVATGS